MLTQDVDLYMTSTSPKLYTRSRDGLWKIMGTQMQGMVRHFHDGMQARVHNDGEFSEPFEVTNSVKQGCVIAQTA